MTEGVPAWIICRLDHEYIAACQKHPSYPKDSYPIIIEELGEAGKAHQEGDIDHEILELVHTMVTLARRIERLSK